MHDATSREAAQHGFIKSVHGVRYQVRDVARSVAFYTRHLGFELKHQQLPAFANVSLGDTPILLSGPGADLPEFIAELKKAGLRFRNEMETGPGGRQVQLEDPDGNPIELFEPAR